VAVLAVTSGCGEDTADPDQANAERIAAEIGVKAKVACDGDTCTLRAQQPLPSADQAWFIALPIVSGVESEPELDAIRRLDLTLANQEGTHEARFACSLRKSPVDLVTVEFVHDRCVGSFSGF